MSVGFRRSVTGAAFAVVLASGALAGCSAGVSSAGSCVGPTIRLGSATALHPGGQVDVSSDWMTLTCEDTGGTNRAAHDIAVTITPRSTGEEVALGTIPSSSGARYTARGIFALPADLPTGTATLTLESPSGDRSTASRAVTVVAS